MDLHQVIKTPLATEKAVKLMENENKLLFEVDIKATKEMIKKSVEALYKVKVKKVNTVITNLAKKRAYVTLAKESKAADVITQTGLM